MRSAIKFGFLFLLLAGIARGQAVRVTKLPSGGATPQAAVSSLSLMASPSSVTFHLLSKGIATGSTPVNITTSWGGSFCLFTCTINVYAYFANASAALVNTKADIPSSAVFGEVTSGTPTSFTPFTESNPLGGAGASLQLLQQSFFLFAGNGSRTDALQLEINLVNQPQLPAGTYNGTLFIQAQAL
jgi:hypothetical protein